MSMNLRSASTASVGSGVVIKFELQKGKEVEVRRLRGDFSFAEIMTAVCHMWGSHAPKHLTLEYIDDEGEKVKVGSEAEWSEAVEQHRASGGQSLRLFVRRGKGRKADPSVETASEGEEEAREPAKAATPVVVPPLKLPEGEPAACQENRAVEQEPSSGEAFPEVEAGDARQTAVVDLLSRLYDCDAGREMMNMFSKIDFVPVVRRRLDAVAGEVLVDIDDAALRHLTISRTNMWIGQRLFEKAESTLQSALAVWTGDKVLEYNAACSAALRGDTGKALQQLELAVEHGYADGAQLKADPDLASVRANPRFAALLEKIMPTATVTATATAPSAPPTSAAAAAPVQPPAAPTEAAKKEPAEKWDATATLMAMFPQLSADAAARVLKRNHGDVAKAANSLL